MKYLPVQASSQWSLRRGWREWDREHRGSRPQHSRNCWQNLWAGSSASARASPSLGLGGSRPSWRWQRTSTWRQESQLKLRSSKNKRKEGKGNVALIAHEWYFSSRLMPESTTALHSKACYSPRQHNSGYFFYLSALTLDNFTSKETFGKSCRWNQILILQW